MAEKFPNKNDKDEGISWVRHPNKLLNKNKNQATDAIKQENVQSKQENVSFIDVKNKDNVAKSKNKTKNASFDGNTNINPPFESSSDSEMTCLDIFEKLVSKFKSGDTVFVKLVDGLCNIYNCKNMNQQKCKIDLIGKLLLNLAQADIEELQRLQNEFKEIFIDESVKKMFVDDEDIILSSDFEVDVLIVGQLKKDGVNRKVYVRHPLFSPIEIRNEAMILSKLNHPNIANMVAVTRNFSKIAFEIDDYTKLKELLFAKEISSNPKTVMEMLIKIAETMAYIHSQDILYNNLTVNSIRIKNENVKIGNFAPAVYVGYSNGEFTNKKFASPLLYDISPDTVKNGIFTTKTDVWAMGMLCFEVFYYLSMPGFFIPLEVAMWHNWEAIHQGLRTLNRPSKCPAVLFLYITEKLLNLDPDKRPNFPEIVKDLKDILRRF